MKEIDWSKAPEGATHYNEHDATTPWRKVDTGGTAYWWDGAEWVRVEGKGYQGGYIAIPNDSAPQWDGTGLPPVGTVCEACWTSPDEYYQIKVLAHDDGKAVCRWLTGPGSGKLSESEDGILGEVSKPHPKFRPIRTAEQIAAEEREKAVDEMMAAYDPWIATRRFCEKLYDSGYRRQESKE